MNDERERNRGTLLFAVVFEVFVGLSLLWILVLLLRDIPATGSDSVDHLHWIAQFNALLDSGRWYPRWMGDSFAGFGLPVFYFYPPLAYYLSWILHRVTPGSDANTLYNMGAALMLIASSVTAYFYFRTFEGSTRQTFFAALLYAVLPYRFFQLFLRDAYSEELALVFLPILFLALDELFHNNGRPHRLKIVVLFAFVVSALVLTNLPVVAMMIIAAVLYIAVRAWSDRSLPRNWPQALIGTLLGLIVSAAYLLPLFAFRNYIHTDFLYSPTFEYLYSLYDIVAVNRSNLFFAPAMMTLIGFVAVIAFYFGKVEMDNRVRAWLALALFVAFLQLPWISFPVWKVLPLLNLTQTSSRWSILLCLSIPIFYLTLREGSARNVFLAAIIILIGITFVHGWTSIDIALHTPREATARSAERDAPEYFPRTSGNNPWIPWHLANDKSMPEVELKNTSDGSISNVHRATDNTTFQVHATQPLQVRFRRWDWVTWQLSTPATANLPFFADSLGLINSTLPAGDYSAQLSIARSSTEKWGEVISLIGVTIFILLLAWYFVATRRLSRKSLRNA